MVFTPSARQSTRLTTGLLVAFVGLALLHGGCRDKKKAPEPTSNQAPKPRPDPAVLHREACRKGNPKSCRILALLVLKRKDTNVRRHRAAKLHAKACSAGLTASCRDLGELVHLGPFSMKQRAAYEKIACEGNDYESCEWCAFRYFHGHGVKRSYEKAAVLFKKACTGGEPESCDRLARMLEEGRGVKKDPVRAADLRRRAVPMHDAACKRSPRGCYLAGYNYHHGRGVKKNLRKAARLYKRACDHFSGSHACKELKKIPAVYRK